MLNSSCLDYRLSRRSALAAGGATLLGMNIKSLLAATGKDHVSAAPRRIPALQILPANVRFDHFGRSGVFGDESFFCGGIDQKGFVEPCKNASKRLDLSDTF